MRSNKNLFVLIVCFLALPVTPIFAQEADLRVKITDNLIQLKRLIIIEETLAQAVNNQIIKENKALTDENSRLKKSVHAKKPVDIKEKIVYRPDSSSQKRIAELERKIAELNKMLQGNSGSSTKTPEPVAAAVVKPQKIDVQVTGISAGSGPKPIQAQVVKTAGSVPASQASPVVVPTSPQKSQNNGFLYRKIN